MPATLLDRRERRHVSPEMPGRSAPVNKMNQSKSVVAAPGVQRRLPRILVLDRACPAQIAAGVWKYLKGRTDWSILEGYAFKEVLDARGQTASYEAATVWVGHAAVVAAHTLQQGEAAARTPCHCVNVLNSLAATALPTVSIDDRRAARLAFEHLQATGASWFGYLPFRAGPDNHLRQAGFIEAAAEAGLGARAMVIESILSQDEWLEAIKKQGEIFLSLPKPMAILCFADWLGALAMHAAQLVGLRIPEDLAIMGIDDENHICEAVEPTLTSVATAQNRVGYEAAALAIALAEGGAKPSAPVLISPLGVIERRSTQLMAVEDEDVASALRYIRQQMEEEGMPPRVPEVCKAVVVSRRGLDLKFVKHLGCTVSEQIERLKVRETLRLLEQTDLAPVAITARLGYSSVAHLSRVVRRETGKPTVAYRRWARMQERRAV